MQRAITWLQLHKCEHNLGATGSLNVLCHRMVPAAQEHLGQRVPERYLGW